MLKENEKNKNFSTISGITMDEIYSQKELEKNCFDYQKDLNNPGEYPFTRGIKPGMYREELWVMGQYSGFGSAEESNKRYRYLLQQGQTGFSIALDLPTQVGLDSDHPMANGEVGKVGVAIDSLEDIENLFRGIKMEKVRQIRTTANSIGPLMAAFFIAFSEKNNIDPNDIKIFLQNDPLKEYISRGTYIFPPKVSVKLCVDVIEYCSKFLKSWVPLALSGYHIRESGGTAIQELAFCFENGMSYFENAIKRGLLIDCFAPSIFTFFTAHIDFLEEIAKFRAARRIWAKVMQEKYNAQDLNSKKLNILAYTAGGVLTAQQPLNNIVRITLEALAAVLGGVQSLATSSYDEAYSIPTEQAVTIALRTQQIIAHESGVTNTVDPLGGSYVLENLTSRIETGVSDYLEKISTLGGAVKCIENGYFQQELSKEAYKFQKSVEEKRRIVVGVNNYKSKKEEPIQIFQSNPVTERDQLKRLKELRSRRNNSLVQKALLNLKETAIDELNIIPASVEAIKAYATLGEIVDVLKEVYGIYKDLGIY